MDSQSTHGLTARIQALGPILAGFRQALQCLSLSEQERQVLANLFAKYGAEYLDIENELKLLKKAGASPDTKQERAVKAKKAKKPKPKPLEAIDLQHKKMRAKKIAEVHKRSGYREPYARIIQGGATGSGKGS